MGGRAEGDGLVAELRGRAAKFLVGAGGHAEMSIEYAWLAPHPGAHLTAEVQARIMVTPRLLRRAADRIEALERALGECRRAMQAEIDDNTGMSGYRLLGFQAILDRMDGEGWIGGADS